MKCLIYLVVYMCLSLLFRTLHFPDSRKPGSLLCWLPVILVITASFLVPPNKEVATLIMWFNKSRICRYSQEGEEAPPAPPAEGNIFSQLSYLSQTDHFVLQAKHLRRLQKVLRSKKELLRLKGYLQRKVLPLRPKGWRLLPKEHLQQKERLLPLKERKGRYHHQRKEHLLLKGKLSQKESPRLSRL